MGVLAGDSAEAAELLAWGREAEVLYAADAGAEVCIARGLAPVVVGDMDSVGVDLAGLRVVRDEDQMTTDCDKLLALVAAEHPEADLVLAGLEGDRLDHVLASLGSVARSGVRTRLLLRQGMGFVVRAGGVLSVTGWVGTRLSVLPLGRAVGSLRGVRWGLEGADLELGGPLSVSNVVEGDLEVESHEGVLLVVAHRRFTPW